MSQPTYSSANGYVSEQFFTLFFDIALDDANPPPTSAFNVQINGTGVSVSAVEVNSTDKSVKITYVANALTPGDIIEFSYQDPTGGNDVNAVQGLDGTDAATFSASTIVLGARPGPSAPPVPTLDNGSDSATLGDHITSDNTPTLSGTSEANATVKLYDTDGTTLLGTTTADGSGNWSITSSQLSDASHTLKVTQTNNLSQTSPLSTGLTLSIDTVANAPTTLAVAAGSDSGTLGDGISNAGTPVITGVSEANATVRLYDTDTTTLLGTATANGSGKWSITSGNLIMGAHTLTAKQTDAAGNVSVASSGFSYTLDTIGPINMALSTNSVPVAGATNGSTVATLSSTDITSVAYGFAVGNGTIDADNGKFSISGTSLTAAQNLSAGAYHIYLKATDAAGNDAFQIFVVNVTNAPSISSIVRAGSASATVPASDTSINYTVTFSESVTGVDISDFTLTPGSTASGAISGISGSGSTYTVTVDTLGGDGTLRLDLNASGTGIQNGSKVGITGGAYVAGQTYSLDHTAPSAPSTPAMTAGTDTGASSSDAITSNTTPVFTGTGEANATVKLYDTDGTTLLGTTTADGGGKWSITSSALGSGPHTVSVKQLDAAGNVSTASSTLAVVIDNTAPTAPATPLLSAGSDSGVSGDFLTNVVAPVITGTAEANATVKLYDTDGTTLLGTTTADGSGKWSITSSTLTSTSHTLTVKQTDVAGNVSKASSGLTLTIDTSVPSTPGTAALQTASDSGTLGDGITKITTPTLIGTGTIGDTVTLYDTNGSTVLGTAVVDGSGNWSITSSTLSDAVHSVTVKQTNPAGTASSASTAFNLTIDSSAPTAPSTPAMTSGTDTGASSSDAITSNVTPVFTGTGEANATVKLYDTDGTTLLGTATADGSGKWSITSSTLSSGPHTLSVKQVDTAGNVSSASSTLAVEIDTTAPSSPATPVLSPASDSGVSGDLLTNIVTPVITGTAEANATVKLYDTDGTTLLGTTTADGSGKWSITSSTLTSASHTLTVKQTDVAGNVSKASSALTLTVDTSVPATPGTAALQTASDSGTLGDGITNITAPTLTGTGTIGDTVTLYDTNGTTVLGTAVVDGSGNWSIISSTLSDAVHSVTVKQTNPAGTTSNVSSAFNLTIDSKAPSAPSAPAMTSGTDTGASSSDAITSNTTPVFTGTGEANATVKLYDTDGTTLLGTATADGSGKWSVTSSALSSGPHTLSVKQLDAAGNVSTASSTLAVVIDTTAPSAPATPVLSAGSDSGVSGDFLTNVVTPVITGTAEANATVKLYDTDGTTLLGTATADGSGKWSITSSTLSSTSHTLTVKQTDAAGNVSGASSALVLNVDTSVPGAPGTPALQTASDSGTVGDGITKITAPTLTGTGTIGDTVTLYDTNGSTVLGTAVVDGSGNWSITSSTLSEAVHSVTVKQTNPAGTASSASAPFNLTIDSTAPVAPGTPSLLPGSDSNIVGDRITNVVTPTVSGTAVANALLTLYDSDGSTVLGTTTADGSGNWSITSSKLADGPHSLQAKQSDAAGNQSVAGGSLQLTVDTSVPSALNLSASKVEATAGSNAIVGTLSSIDSPDGGSFTYALVAGSGATDNALFTVVNGVLHINDPATAGAGEHSIRVSTTDVAGNTLEKVLSITVFANQPPVVSGLNSSIQTILAGTPVALNQLTITDPDSSDLSVTLTVSNGVVNNVKDADTSTPGIQLTGTPAQIAAALAGATFVTLDAGNASLSISVTDHVIANPVSASYQFKVTPPPLVDGVPVVAFPVMLPGGGNGNSVYVPTVTSTRVDDTGNSSLADIPLVTENSNSILSAHVPIGYGLTASGGASQSAGTSLEHLIAAIIASTPNNAMSDQAHLTGNGQNFLSLLPSSVPLLVQTVKPSSGATAPTQALQLNGNSTTTQHTALVIDASQLPDGSTINLQQVDFAAVVGNANVSGTTNGQILTGDAGNQHFTVGTTQTSQIFSGAGSDTLQFGTAAGLQAALARAQAPLDSVSLLHGGSGLDNAVFTLSAASYHVTQHDGYALVTNLATPSQQVQLVNVETVKFADQTVTLEHRTELNTLAGMYVSILGRQADVGGFDYWGGLQNNRTGLGEIAVAMMNTTEGHGKGFSFNGQSSHDVEQLYKGLFNRASDAEGLAYWSHLMDNGTLTLVGVANAFIAAQEMNGHKLTVTGWDFLV